MAETKAEDDDEGFGDFKFASFPTISVHSDQINDRNSTAITSTDNNDDDDEWGDFVESPLRSELPGRSSLSQSPLKTSEPSKPFDPFGFFSVNSTSPSQSVETRTESVLIALESGKDLSDNSTEPFRSVETHIESVPNGVESGKPQWVKPKGALPLSIFGDAEEEDGEEQSGAIDPPVRDAKHLFSDKHVAGDVKNGSNINMGIGINDLIANLYNQGPQIKAENGLVSNSSGSNSNLNGMNSNSNGISSNMNCAILNPSGLDSKSDSGNNDLDINKNLNNQNQHIKTLDDFNFNSNGLDLKLNASSSNPSGLNLDFNRLNSNLDSVSGNEEFDVDDDGWEFKDANSESKAGDGNDKGHVVSELSGFKIQSTRGQEMQLQEISEVISYSSGFGNGLHGSIDLFASLNGSSSKFWEMENGFHLPSTVAEDGFTFDLNVRSEHNDIENQSDSQIVVGNADFDESFGDFEVAFSEAGLKPGGEPNINGLSHSEVEVHTFDGENQGNETRSVNHRGALPLSIFGDGELEMDSSSSVQDVFIYKPDSSSRIVNAQGSNISVSDLISNLYSQAGQIPSVDSMQKPTKNGLDSIEMVFDSNIGDDADDFDNGSWEFKDALSETKGKDQASLLSLGDAHQNFSTKLKLNNYVDFYSQLRDELLILGRSHLESLKKAQSTAALSGEDMKVAALEEIQEVYIELQQENLISKEAYAEDHPPKDICLSEFIEVLHEPMFQVLEIEYHLSRRLSLAEEDLRSAIELIKHATTMLKILTFQSMEEQSVYVSAWSKIISVCAQELKHGAWIWKQSLEKNVQSQILSEAQGKRFVLALGEIYRVVVVLEASVKLYKPWILSSSVDSATTFAILEECHSLWSDSQLEEALPNISDSIDVEYNGTGKTLLESIKYIRNLDALALGNQVFTQQDSLCRLSILTPGVLPDMKMVDWDGEQYFLTLANLWANLVSCEPPKLPHLRVG